MSKVPSLIEHLAPDTIRTLVQAAQRRYDDGERLAKDRPLVAVYMWGFAVEMCLGACYYRSIGLSQTAEIDRDTRQRRMAYARQLGLMSNEGHPIVGWARLLQHQHKKAPDETRNRKKQALLQEAVTRAEKVYRQWRPELRYKLTDVSQKQFNEVRESTLWFLKLQTKL
jgi:hypothetical protein